ncbi:uncharacterized protein FFM5_14810 [Fusarium fujikuroi]|nr:uncharacterized protein FFM5_14810 [Fusarium fujikuroi]
MDLDIHTVKRAEGFLNATEDKNGSCISDDPAEDQLKEMHERRHANLHLQGPPIRPHLWEICALVLTLHRADLLLASVRDRPWPLDLLFENSPTRFLSDG